MEIQIIPDEMCACPGCGAYWGHPDERLNWCNRQKVDQMFKCYNPDCKVGYYDIETGKTELKHEIQYETCPDCGDTEKIAKLICLCKVTLEVRVWKPDE